jgi:hypothetical protein
MIDKDWLRHEVVGAAEEWSLRYFLNIYCRPYEANGTIIIEVRKRYGVEREDESSGLLFAVSRPLTREALGVPFDVRGNIQLLLDRALANALRAEGILRG